MSLEDDIRTTVQGVREDYKQEKEGRERFQEEWRNRRNDLISPAFRSAGRVLRELDWQCRDEYPNNSAKLSLGEMHEGQTTPTWRYILTLKPDASARRIAVLFRKLQEEEAREAVSTAELEDPALIDRIITDFTRFAEEDLGQRHLPT